MNENLAHWDADRHLTVGQVRAAIQAQFPSLNAGEPTYLGSGWEFDVYATNDGWVFRFPRRREIAALFDTERRVLPLVRNALPDWIGVPQIERLGLPTDAFPYPFAGHRFVPGVHADSAEAPTNSALPSQLAQALKAFHCVDSVKARAVGIGEDLEGAPEFLQEAQELAPYLRGLDSVVDAALDWLGRAPRPPAPYKGSLRFIHNDLCPEHILVDPRTGDLTGLIDWTDAALADPALDFVVFATWKGLRFLDSVLEAYPDPADPGRRDRVVFLARVLSPIWLHEAIQQRADVAKHTRWIANAFAVTDPS